MWIDEEKQQSHCCGGMVGAIPFGLVLRTVCVAQANVATHSSTTELPRSPHQFHTNRFFPEPGMRRKRVHNRDNIYRDAVESVKRESY